MLVVVHLVAETGAPVAEQPEMQMLTLNSMPAAAQNERAHALSAQVPVPTTLTEFALANLLVSEPVFATQFLPNSSAHLRRRQERGWSLNLCDLLQPSAPTQAAMPSVAGGHRHIGP